MALVTGSGRGLERMIAETLLAGGAAVALHDLNEERARTVWRKPQPDGAGANVLQARRQKHRGDR